MNKVVIDLLAILTFSIEVYSLFQNCLFVVKEIQSDLSSIGDS